MPSIRVIPVIDLKGGVVVRGIGGRREEYRPIVSRLADSAAPLDVARAFRDQCGFTELYLADLDAIAGAEPAWDTYDKLRGIGYRLWVDAGVGNPEQLIRLEEHRVEHPIVALETLANLTRLAEFGQLVGWDKLVFSLDMREGYPITSSNAHWGSEPIRIADAVIALGVRRLIVLDLAAVGSGQGPPDWVLRLANEVRREHSDVELIAGGGVRGAEDLKTLEDAGISAALVASALHDGRFSTKPGPRAVIEAVELRIRGCHALHCEIADEIPDGPQRLRGLAGSGKTTIFTHRIARIHAQYPEWNVVYVFFTRSLYDQIRSLIASSYSEMTGSEPNWDKLRVLHAWGAKEQDGFYRALCRLWGQRPLSLKDVEQNAPECTAGEAFEYICDLLEQDVPRPPQLFDAILIDEGQDLPASFYRLAHKTLRPPKRLYWAYDEAQGISSLIVPRPKAIFGTDDSGRTIVDLRGKYPDGIAKAHNLNRSYRTPALLLMAGHALNMGLLRKDGPLQGVTHKEEWEALGYEIVEGDFSPANVHDRAIVKMRRAATALAHPVDLPDSPLDPRSTLSGRTFPTESAEQAWIAEQVSDDLRKGFHPEDLLVTHLGGDRDKEYLAELKTALERRGVPACMAGVDTNRSQFRKNGHVTLASVYRAKGNEAWKVYACRFHLALQPQAWKKETELQKRNEALVALTRAKLWCVVTGLRSPIFDELRAVKEQYPYLSFPAFSQASLRRVLDVELFPDND